MWLQVTTICSWMRVISQFNGKERTNLKFSSILIDIVVGNIVNFFLSWYKIFFKTDYFLSVVVQCPTTRNNHFSKKILFHIPITHFLSLTSCIKRQGTKCTFRILSFEFYNEHRFIITASTHRVLIKS